MSIAEGQSRLSRLINSLYLGLARIALPERVWQGFRLDHVEYYTYGIYLNSPADVVIRDCRIEQTYPSRTIS